MTTTTDTENRSVPPGELDSLPAWLSAEYDAARAEILLRLGFQQQMINYSFVVAGLLAPILALTQIFGAAITLPILLLGPLACVFLELVYIKHSMYIDLLARYIAQELKADVKLGADLPPVTVRPFQGWEHYLARHRADKSLNSFTTLLGYAEAGFPALVGAVYLVGFVAVLRSPPEILAPSAPSYPRLLAIWAMLDVVGLVASVAIGVMVRRRGAAQRNLAVMDAG